MEGGVRGRGERWKGGWLVACIVAQSLIATFSSRRSRQSSQDPEEIEHMPCDDGGGGGVVV